jgi:hypothetical protein
MQFIRDAGCIERVKTCMQQLTGEVCQPFIQTILNTTIISQSLFINYCIIIHSGGHS